MKELIHQSFKFYLQKTPIKKGRERLLRWLWRPLSFGQYVRSGMLKNTAIKLDCDLTKYLQRHLYYFGEYEPSHCQLWSQLAKEASVIFDVGANVGLYSLLAAAANSSAVIHCFEPTPEIFATCCNAIRRNSISNIIPHAEAVGAGKGTVYLHRQWGVTGDNEGMNYVTDCPTSSEGMAIPRISLDDFCHEQKIERIDLLKIDVEGGEYDVLKGAAGLLSAHCIACILMEFDENNARQKGHTTVELRVQLESKGYAIYMLKKGRLKLVKTFDNTNGNIWACSPGFVRCAVQNLISRE